MDDAAALAGLRLLVAGGDLSVVGPVRDRLTALGADVVAIVGDYDGVARAVAETPPAAVLAAPGIEPQLRARLDPFGIEAGPPIVPIAPGDEALVAAGAARLRALVERPVAAGRARELEAALADHALARRRDAGAAERDTLARLLQAAGYRDDNTYEHTQRVGALAARLAGRLGLPAAEVALIHAAAPLHDIGKIAIPDSILLKPGRLTAEEFEVVKTHAVLGARVLAGGESDLLRAAERTVRSHHERWDGTGYPDGLAGTEIALEGRLVHVADVFDVLVHERPYRESFTVEAAAAEIAAGAGSEFDPGVAAVFARLAPD
ncbi:MAG TPA: HD domain-containing phosphohydrolase [Solirubrobacter sp.]|nr:HD domain-containing phosphohydrolase [Solirubrobacter sp.]